MPTPNDETAHSTTPTGPATSSRNSFASCPPEEDRPHNVQPESVLGTDRSRPPSDFDADGQDGDQRRSRSSSDRTSRHSSPESTGESMTSDGVQTPVETGKAEHIEDAGVMLEPSSPTMGPAADAPSDSETRLAQSMSAAAISSATPPPQYLHFPDMERHRQRSIYSKTSFLRPGSKFRGSQQSDLQVYDVQVEIKDVDLAESTLCGYLRIQGLTDDHPTLTTFFEGEIVGDKYTFKTTHPSWNSSEKIDLQHWARFPAWKQLAKSAKTPNFSLKNYQQREHLFMRWKEYFLVPDHRVKIITGASFEGFYYICFNQCSGNVSGIYFHAKSEKYQKLELKHVDDRGCMSAVDFR